MKKKLAFLYAVLFVIFAILLIMKKNSNVNIKEQNDEIDIISNSDFAYGQNISLLLHKNNQISDLDLNYYILCVVASEMPFKFEYEALKSQVVVARTYLFNKIVSNGEELADVCDDYNHCQAFLPLEDLERIWKEEKGFSDEEIKKGEEKIKKAIMDTKDLVIVYNGQIIDALFHSSSYLKTEDAKAIWSHADVPYLKSVESVEEEYETSTSVVNLEKQELFNTLKNNGYLENVDNLDIAIHSYTDSGRVEYVKFGNSLVEATILRSLIGLKSTYFTIDDNGKDVSFNVLGFGHGVGLSQVGADTYAKQGMSFRDIIHHYYTDVDIVKMKYTKEKGVEYEN